MSQKRKRGRRSRKRSIKAPEERKLGPVGLAIAALVAVAGSGGVVTMLNYWETRDLDRAERVIALYGELVDQFGEDSKEVRNFRSKLNEAIKDAGRAEDGDSPNRSRARAPEEVARGDSQMRSGVSAPALNLERIDAGESDIRPDGFGRQTTVDLGIDGDGPRQGGFPKRDAVDSALPKERMRSGAGAANQALLSVRESRWVDTEGRTHIIAGDMLRLPRGPLIETLLRQRYPPSED